MKTRKVIETQIRRVGPVGWTLNENIAKRLWGKWALSNIALSQKSINQKCGLERLVA